MQGEDNDYYLDHAYTNEYMACGSIFADYRAYKNMEYNRNTVLYGHNMNNGTMFNNVTKFLDEDFFNSTNITIYTLDGIYTYEPFAIFETISTFQYFRMRFQDDADFVSFCEKMQEAVAVQQEHEVHGERPHNNALDLHEQLHEHRALRAPREAHKGGEVIWREKIYCAVRSAAAG